jgi:nucleotide-binding universal stress UspA family protein
LVVTKILVPLDGSTYADKALKYAVEIAKKFNATLTLVHVIVEPPPLVSGAAAPEAIPFLPQMHTVREELGKKILAKGEETVKSMGLQADTVLESGHPSEIIINTAKNRGIDLIVVGSRGVGGIKGFFLGSVSDKVSHHAPCPVLIVR